MIKGCAGRGVAYVPYFAIIDAKEARTADTHDDAVLAVAHAHGSSPQQVRLAWTLHQDPNMFCGLSGSPRTPLCRSILGIVVNMDGCRVG